MQRKISSHVEVEIVYPFKNSFEKTHSEKLFRDPRKLRRGFLKIDETY